MSSREIERWARRKGGKPYPIYKKVPHKFDNNPIVTREWYEKNSNLTEWSQNLDADTMEAFNTYWKEPSRLTNNQKQLIESALSNFELYSPIITYHGADMANGLNLIGEHGAYVDGYKNLIGKTKILQKFLSTSSTERNFTEFNEYGRGVQYEIVVPSGKGLGAYIGNISSNIAEQEFLINKNLKFNISNMGIENDGRYNWKMIYLEILNK